MDTAELKLVSTLNEFMEWAAQFNQGVYFFRGLTNEEYNISASAYRRLNNTGSGNETPVEDFEKFVQINKGLIRDVRLQDLDWKNGRKLKDLEILAELQHFRAATCLIDFTYNALIALWFACEQSSEDVSKCGKVVAIQTDKGHEIRDITLELLEKEIDYFFLGNDSGMHQQLYKWQPSHQNNRIIAQQSIFLFGTVEINPNKECIILGSAKRQIQESLKQLHGITEAMLFPDFEGFARVHRQDIPYTSLAASQYRNRGHQKLNQGQFKENIANFTEAMKVDPSNSTDYQNRGAITEMLLNKSVATDKNQYDGILNDYAEAIKLDPNAPATYYQRGVLRSKIGRTHEAVFDLEKALQIAQAIGNEGMISTIQNQLSAIKQASHQTHSDTEDSQEESQH